MYFSFSGSSSILTEQFNAVSKRIRELALMRDGNGYSVLQLVAGPKCRVRSVYLAFRFTSDWAYDQYNRELVSLGGSLARGVWDPWKDSMSESYRLMMQPSPTEEVAMK